MSMAPEHPNRDAGDVATARPAAPVLGRVLRRAREHRHYSLRDVEARTGIPNPHLSQIERGQIRRPDAAIIWRLAELYGLDFGLLAEWAGHRPAAERESPTSTRLDIAMRMLSELSEEQIEDVLRQLESLRRRS
jgi:transcriptional regulator with XRE-family HTH domain